MNQLKRERTMKETISFKLNGEHTTINVEGDRKLLWVLRTDFGLTGTKYGCGKVCAAHAPSSLIKKLYAPADWP